MRRSIAARDSQRRFGRSRRAHSGAGAARAAPGFDRRAMLALAACAVFGVVLGYGGGLLAPAPMRTTRYFTDGVRGAVCVRG